MIGLVLLHHTASVFLGLLWLVRLKLPQPEGEAVVVAILDAKNLPLGLAVGLRAGEDDGGHGEEHALGGLPREARTSIMQ
jgi:hypothetical protein